MIELRLSRVRLNIHPLAALLPSLGMLLGLGAEIPALMLSLLVHESGHFIAARLVRVRICALTVMPFGCGLQLGNVYALSPGQLFAVSAGGPLTSLLLLLTDGALVHWGMLSPTLALALLRVTLALLLFNLLPALPLDGGRMLYALTSRWLGRDRAVRLCAQLGYGMAATLVVCALWLWRQTHRFNLTLPACAVFILKGISDDKRALGDAPSESLLNTLNPREAPVPLRLWAVSDDYPALKALRCAVPNTASAYAVYQGGLLRCVVDETALLRLAIDHPEATVGEAAKKQPRIA